MAKESEWRRSWSPTIDAQSWKHFKVAPENETESETPNYIFKTKFSDNSYEIMVSDFKNIWHNKEDGENIDRICKKLNPSVEASTKRLVEQIRSSLAEKIDSSTFAVSVQGDVLQWVVNSQLAELPFKWQFECTLNNHLLSSQLTMPLVAMVGELTRRQQELTSLLKNKDKEIDDYKSQGVKTSRKHLMTTKFDELTFNKNMATSKGFEGVVRQPVVSGFSAGGQNMYSDVMTKMAWINRPIEEAQDGSSLAAEGASLISEIPGGQTWENRVPESLGKGLSPTVSPARPGAKRTPDQSPGNKRARLSSPEQSPVKDAELIRREALEKKLAEEEIKLEQKAKKKKKKGLF
ncbi:unnamed protein product [Owenia fusiformis]|uniref:Non-homologous end-joining factor 1 n=1 Tax=Owenia fusiformis TaxID=6347 RepID=A0A8S4N2R8_OWEFU|nr:unnamed protein product [Owenia fusiformis]